PALGVDAAEIGEPFVQGFGFDAFGGDRQIQAPAERSYRLHKRVTAFGIEEQADQPAVDLDPVKRHRAQHRERAVDRAKIVDRDAYPAFAQRRYGSERGLMVFEQTALHDLQLEARGWETGRIEQRLDALRDQWVVELNRR